MSVSISLSPDESLEHGRLLNEFVRAQEAYKELLPRPLVANGAGEQPWGPALAEEQLRRVQEADAERLRAREALFRFRAMHGMQ